MPRGGSKPGRVVRHTPKQIRALKRSASKAGKASAAVQKAKRAKIAEAAAASQTAEAHS